jgi:hypothetical protein
MDVVKHYAASEYTTVPESLCSPSA